MIVRFDPQVLQFLSDPRRSGQVLYYKAVALSMLTTITPLVGFLSYAQ
jgi:hypothetical protein